MHSRLIRPLLGLTFAMASWIAGAAVATVDPLPPQLSEGELLLGELNCIACHKADAVVAQRLESNPAPHLGTNGLRLNPVWVKAWLENPSAKKVGTRMPGVLHSLSDTDRATTAEVLAHYLASIQPGGEAAGAEGEPTLVARGERLYHEVGCVACHAPFADPKEGGPAAREAAARQSIPLGALAEKYPAAELARFLEHPLAHRAGGRMPQQNLTADEALAVATYLVREQVSAAGNGSEGLIPGLRMRYYEGQFGRCADLSSATPKTMGSSEGIPSKLPERGENYGLVLSGFIEIPADGKYTFWTHSDDGSTVQVDDRIVVDNDGTHGGTTRQGEMELKQGLHPFELRFFQGGGGAELEVTWAGPGFQQQPIPEKVFRRRGAIIKPLGFTEFTVDPAKAALGKAKFAELNCGACHAISELAEGTVHAVAATPLSELPTHSQGGCLADAVPSSAPRYDLSDAQRRALRNALGNLASLYNERTSAEKVAATMARLNCYACHQRDGFGGPEVHAKAPWFKIVGDADLGEEGRLPPHLNRVGGKLRAAWLEQLLREGTKVRPYMATRMPVFGDATRALPALLMSSDRVPDSVPEPTPTERDAKLGQKLVGRDGLSCVSCHTFAQYASLGIPALGLERMHERLEYDWFRRYLPDPAALRPGTRMPSFWPDGKAVNTSILGGDTDAQIRAIWAWMRDGAKAEVPAGLIRGHKEILVAEDAVIYRNFVEGAGPRAIGVGYPEHASLAFDANQLRLAMIWQGSFIDAARHSTDRGTGFEPPLGDHVFHFPEGDAFAVLPDSAAVWPPATHRSAHGKFLGYRLDEKQRPTFRYRVDGVTIEDYPTVRSDGVDATLTRIFKCSGKPDAGTLWFRAVVGDIKEVSAGEYEINGRLRFKFPGHPDCQIVQRELRMAVPPNGEFIEEITW